MVLTEIEDQKLVTAKLSSPGLEKFLQEIRFGPLVHSFEIPWEENKKHNQTGGCASNRVPEQVRDTSE